MITYQVESLRNCADEMKVLGAAHWEEVKYAPFEDTKFGQDEDIWFTLEDGGMLRAITARDDGSLVGYLVVLSAPMMNHALYVMATEVGFYVSRTARNGRVGIGLVRFAEELCQKAGIHFLTLSVTPAVDCSNLYERCGFVATERSYTKRLN